jgi:serine/threonine protein kinase
MSARHADVGALTDQFRELVESSRRSEGVWHTAHLRDGLPVYVLSLAPVLAAKITKPEGFFAELERAAGFKTPGVSRPVSWGKTTSGEFHCAYVHDTDPSSVNPGVKPATEVAVVGAHLARTLASVHQAGLVHGAVSLNRILRAANGSVQLGAFGLYPALVAGGVDRRDAALQLSDIAYVSPEGRLGDALDARSDVYSLGAALYELITGKPPFGGRTTSFVMASVLSEDDDAAAATNAKDSGLIVDAVLRAIERAPDDRWPNATAFALALEAEAGDVEDTEGGSRSLLSIFKGAWFPARRSRE